MVMMSGGRRSGRNISMKSLMPSEGMCLGTVEASSPWRSVAPGKSRTNGAIAGICRGRAAEALGVTRSAATGVPDWDLPAVRHEAGTSITTMVLQFRACSWWPDTCKPLCRTGRCVAWMMREEALALRRSRGESIASPWRMDHSPRVVQGRVRRESDMPLMTVIITLIVVGILLWLVNTYIPMDGKIKQILNVVAVVGVVLWLLNVFGLFSGLGNVRVGNG